MEDLRNYLHLYNSEIAEQFGIGRTTVKVWLQKQGLPTNRFSRAERRLGADKVLKRNDTHPGNMYGVTEDLLRSGKTATEIARELGCTAGTVKHHARKYGIVLKKDFKRVYESTMMEKYGVRNGRQLQAERPSVWNSPENRKLYNAKRRQKYVPKIDGKRNKSAAWNFKAYPVKDIKRFVLIEYNSITKASELFKIKAYKIREILGAEYTKDVQRRVKERQKELTRETVLSRYGVEHNLQLPELREKVCSESVRIKCLESTKKTFLKNGFISKGEESVYQFLKEITPEVNIIRGNYSVLRGRELDIYIPEHKLAIEYNGNYWHSVQTLAKKDKEYNTFSKACKYHQDKTLACREKGIHLVHIWEWEWADPRIRERLKSQIKGVLGLSQRVFARSTTVKELSPQEAREFFNVNSEFKYKNLLKAFALMYNNRPVMAFGVSYLQNGRGYDRTQFEIARSATVLNTVVVGGSSKLMKAVKDYLQGAPVHYFVDLDKHTGSSLEAMGATLINVGPPSLRIMFRRPVTLRNSRGECKSFEAERLYSRQPKFHAAVKEQEAEDNLITLANAGTLHYVI